MAALSYTIDTTAVVRTPTPRSHRGAYVVWGSDMSRSQPPSDAGRARQGRTRIIVELPSMSQAVLVQNSPWARVLKSENRRGSGGQQHRRAHPRSRQSDLGIVAKRKAVGQRPESGSGTATYTANRAERRLMHVAPQRLPNYAPLRLPNVSCLRCGIFLKLQALLRKKIVTPSSVGSLHP